MSLRTLPASTCRSPSPRRWPRRSTARTMAKKTSGRPSSPRASMRRGGDALAGPSRAPRSKTTRGTSSHATSCLPPQPGLPSRALRYSARVLPAAVTRDCSPLGDSRPGCITNERPPRECARPQARV